jgi:cellobiose phosphorylase
MREKGMNDLISEFILNKKHPSYYAFVLAGETTLGEYWEDNPRSHNHTMMGHIVEWYYNGIAGILPLEPGFSKVRIKPWLPPSMNTMKCNFHSANGDIMVSMKRERSGVILLDVNVDERIDAVVDRSQIDV